MQTIVKVFISQRMNGFTDDFIKETRAKMERDFREFTKVFGIPCSGLKIVNPVDQEEGHKRVWYLGQSISTMENADFIIFSKDWAEAYGCAVEHAVVQRYFKNHLDGKNFGKGNIAEIWYDMI